MKHGRAAVLTAGHVDPAVAGAVLTRLGLAVVALTLPAAAGAFAGLLANTGSPAAAVAAMNGPLLGGGGLPWLFHVAALVLLCGCWLLGAGLLLDGLFD